MAIPSSGQLSLSMLIAEFGGGTKLTDFYRGGARVPNTAANASVPTSGQISLSNFYGAVNLIPLSVSGPTSVSRTNTRSAPGPASISITGIGPTSLTVSGGSGTQTYSWVRLSGGTNITTPSPSSLNPTFSASGVAKNTTSSAVFRLTVSDSSGSATYDVTVSATYQEIA